MTRVGTTVCAVAFASALSLSCAAPATSAAEAESTTGSASAEMGPPPSLTLDSEEDAVRALNARFATLVDDPRAFDRELAISAQRFPEGDLLPLTLVVSAYARRFAAGDIGARAPLDTFVDRAVAAVRAKLGVPLEELADCRGQGTYLANLNLALSEARASGASDRHNLLNDHLSRLLREAITDESGAPIRSYPDQAWPIDTAIALASLAVRARHLGEPAPRELIAAFQRWTNSNQGSDPALALPYARTDSHSPMPPRGSDLSWRIAILADVDPAWAQALYQTYADAFWRESLFARGFAEWADDSTRADVDSGPIIAGVGATASTFGIAAAAVAGDTTRREQLIAQLGRGRFMVEQSHGARIAGLPIDAHFVTGFFMGDAVLFYALSVAPP